MDLVNPKSSNEATQEYHCDSCGAKLDPLWDHCLNCGGFHNKFLNKDGAKENIAPMGSSFASYAVYSTAVMPCTSVCWLPPSVQNLEDLSNDPPPPKPKNPVIDPKWLDQYKTMFKRKPIK